MSSTTRKETDSEKVKAPVVLSAHASVKAKDFGVLPILRHLRHSAEDGHPPFSLLLNAIFGFACCCSLWFSSLISGHGCLANECAPHSCREPVLLSAAIE